MNRKDLFGILYVSAWVIIWGSFGSIIDLPLLQADVYIPGSIGQVTTFAVSAIISILVSVLLFSRASNFFLKESD